MENFQQKTDMISLLLSKAPSAAMWEDLEWKLGGQAGNHRGLDQR